MTLTLKSFLSVFILSFFFSVSSAQIISTIAGNGTNSSCGDGGQATSACIQVSDVAVDASGNVYIAGGVSIRKVTPAGVISTIAGGTNGTGGDGGPAIDAQFISISAIGIDQAGNLYISDNYRIRKINTSGIITTIAGSTIQGFSGDNGPATSALFGYITDIGLDISGNIFVSDPYNRRVRKINTSGIISTIAGNGTQGFSEGVATQSMLSNPRSVAVDASGNIYIADLGCHRILKVNTGGMLNAICGTGLDYPGFDGVLANNSHAANPVTIAVNTSGDIFFTSWNRIRIIRPNNYIYTFAGIAYQSPGTFSGDGGLAISATLNYPMGMAFDASNNLYIADAANYRVRKVSICTGVPPQPVNLTGNDHPCPFSSYTYSVPQGTNMSYYEWTLPPGWTMGDYGSGSTVTVNTSAYGGTVSVSYNNLCGAGTPQVLATPINDTPLAQIYPIADPYVLCSGQTLTLSGTPGVGYTYNWYSGTSFNIPYSTDPTVEINGGGFYPNFCLKIVDAEGCYGRVCAEQQIPMVTIANLTSPYTICQGDSFMLVATTNSDTMYNIQWKKNGVNVPGATNDTFYATQAGDYSIAAVNQCNLFFPATSIMTLYVGDTATFDVTASGPLTFCPGGSVTLNISNISGFGGINWYHNGNSLSWPASSLTTNMSGVYTATVGYTCFGSSAPFVVVSDTPEAIITANGPTVFCEGDEVVLNANTGTGYTYQWLLNNVIIPGATAASYTATSSGLYHVDVDEGLCSDISDQINITVNPLPAPAITQSGNDLSVPSGFLSYQWYLNGTAISGANSETYTATQDGDYYVIVSDGCEGQSNTVNLFLSVGDVNATGNTIVIRPNPFSDFAVLSFSNAQHAPHSFKLYNVQGQLVQEVRDIATNELRIERGMLSTGIYYFQLHSDKGIVGSGKVVIQ